METVGKNIQTSIFFQNDGALEIPEDDIEEVELTEDDKMEQDAFDFMFPDSLIDDLDGMDEKDEKEEKEEKEEKGEKDEKQEKYEKKEEKEQAMEVPSKSPSPVPPLRSTDAHSPQMPVLYPEVSNMAQDEHGDQPSSPNHHSDAPPPLVSSIEEEPEALKETLDSMFPDSLLDKLEKTEKPKSPVFKKPLPTLFEQLILMDELAGKCPAPPNITINWYNGPTQHELAMAHIFKPKYFVYVKKRGSVTPSKNNGAQKRVHHRTTPRPGGKKGRKLMKTGSN